MASAGDVSTPTENQADHTTGLGTGGLMVNNPNEKQIHTLDEAPLRRINDPTLVTCSWCLVDEDWKQRCAPDKALVVTKTSAQQFTIPHVVISFHRRQPMAEEGAGMQLLVC